MQGAEISAGRDGRSRDGTTTLLQDNSPRLGHGGACDDPTDLSVLRLRYNSTRPPSLRRRFFFEDETASTFRMARTRRDTRLVGGVATIRDALLGVRGDDDIYLAAMPRDPRDFEVAATPGTGGRGGVRGHVTRTAARYRGARERGSVAPRSQSFGPRSVVLVAIAVVRSSRGALTSSGLRNASRKGPTNADL